SSPWRRARPWPATSRRSRGWPAPQSEETPILDLMHDFVDDLLKFVVREISGAHRASGGRRVHQLEVGQDALHHVAQDLVLGVLRAGLGQPVVAEVEAAQRGRGAESVGELEWRVEHHVE